MIPFCRAGAAGSGEVRLPGSGSSVYWVYTATETAALHDRCASLLQALNATS